MQETLYTLADIKDYFRHCAGNAAMTGIAKKRFEKYIEALETAMNEMLAKDNNVPDKNVGEMFGRWVKTQSGVTPGGTPCYVCGKCGGSAHLHGAEYQRRKIICDCCRTINIYPWEKAYEEGSSLWPESEPQKEGT